VDVSFDLKIIGETLIDAKGKKLGKVIA